MYLVTGSLVLCALLGDLLVWCNPTEPRTPVKIFQNALAQQSLDTILTSIEERLRNLDNVYSMQYSPSVEGRLQHYGRKLESVEAKISRLEALVSNEAGKLMENISARSFKDDITNERVLRKIDYAYDRLSHRLIFAESKMDMAERKLDEKLDMVLTRLEKMDENFSTRDHDMQTDFADMIATVEDVKIQTESIEDKLEHFTKNVSGVKHVGPNYPHGDGITGLSLSKEIRDHFEILSDKMVGFHESSWKTYDELQTTLRSMSLVANQTRYEIQSGLRSLTVEVGRMAGHTNFGNSSKNKDRLDQLEQKIDDRFENVMMAQSMFLESCYRVQKDEAQLENKIGEVLEKLLETFLQKTAVEPKDLRKLEQMLIGHDQHIKRAIGKLLDEKKFQDGINSLTSNVANLFALIEEEGNVNEIITNRLEQVLTAIKDVQSLSFDINGNIKQLSKVGSIQSCDELTLITEKLENIHETEATNLGNCETLLKTTDEIHQLLINLLRTNEMSNFATNRTEIPDTNIANTTNNPISNITEGAQTRDPALVQLINDIFNQGTNNITQNCLDFPIDVRTRIDCTTPNVNVTSDVGVNETSNAEVKPNVNISSPIDSAEYPDIDVRSQETITIKTNNSKLFPNLDSINNDTKTTNTPRTDELYDLVEIDNAAGNSTGKIKRADEIDDLSDTYAQ